MAPYCNLEFHFFNWFSYSLSLSSVLRISQPLISRNPRQVLACITVSQCYVLTPSLSVITFPLEFLFSKLFKVTPNKPDVIGRCLSRLKLHYFLNYIWGMSGRQNHCPGPNTREHMTVYLIWHFPSFQHRSRARTFLSLSREIWMFPKADLVITVIQ